MTAYDALIKQGLEQGLEQGLKQGLEQGLEQGKVEVILEGFKNNLSVQLLSDITGMTVEKVNQVINNRKN